MLLLNCNHIFSQHKKSVLCVQNLPDHLQRDFKDLVKQINTNNIPATQRILQRNPCLLYCLTLRGNNIWTLACKRGPRMTEVVRTAHVTHVNELIRARNHEALNDYFEHTDNKPSHDILATGVDFAGKSPIDIAWETQQPDLICYFLQSGE